MTWRPIAAGSWAQNANPGIMTGPKTRAGSIVVQTSSRSEPAMPALSIRSLLTIPFHFAVDNRHVNLGRSKQ